MSEEVEFVPTSLDVIMGGADDTPPEPEAEVKVEAEKEPEKVEEKAEPEVEEAKKPDEEVSDWRKMAAVIEEKTARIKELESSRKEPEKAPDVFEDQDAFVAHLDKKTNSTILNMSVEMAREQYSDYDEVEARFLKEAETNPAIVGNIQGKANQALAAYREGKKLLELDKIGDPVEYRAKLKAEILEELKADVGKAKEADDKKEQALKDALPDDLTSESNAGKRTEKKVFTPTSLDAIL